jgi:hypothetical protein
MDAMQRRLDADRDALPHTRDYVVQWQRHFRYSDAQIKTFTDAANRLIALNDYRRRGVGWTEQDPKGNDTFKELRASEQDDRATVSSTLSGVAAHAENAGRPDAQATAAYLRSEYQRFESIPSQQTELYEARREHAAEITRSTREAIPHAPNQIVDVANSGGQSYLIYRDHVSDYDLSENEEVMIGQSAVLGAHFGTGTCNEQSAYAFSEANRTLRGTEVTMMNVPPEHGMVIIGPPNRPESAHIDTWPTNPAVTSPETYGIDNIQEGFAIHQTVADGRDLRGEAMSHLPPLPERPAPAPPITLEQAAAFMRAKGSVAEDTHYITSTTGQPQHGHALSRAAFTAHAANGFRIEPPSGLPSPAAAQAQIASAVNEFHPAAGQGRSAPYSQGPSAGPQGWAAQAGHGLPPGLGGGGAPRPESPSGQRRR